MEVSELFCFGFHVHNFSSKFSQITLSKFILSLFFLTLNLKIFSFFFFLANFYHLRLSTYDYKCALSSSFSSSSLTSYTSFANLSIVLPTVNPGLEKCNSGCSLTRHPHWKDDLDGRISVFEKLIKLLEYLMVNAF